MRCFRAIRLLQLYIDEQLTLDQKRSLEFHLFSCMDCRHELHLLKEIDAALKNVEQVYESPNLTENIMQRIAHSECEKKRELIEQPAPVVWYPSLREFFVAVLLATSATWGIFLTQLALCSSLPFANGHDTISSLWLNLWNSLSSMNANTLMLCLWVGGTAIGVWITLALAGAEMRNAWLHAVMQRLPSW
jgi:hypothetical protein